MKTPQLALLDSAATYLDDISHSEGQFLHVLRDVMPQRVSQDKLRWQVITGSFVI